MPVVRRCRQAVILVAPSTVPVFINTTILFVGPTIGVAARCTRANDANAILNGERAIERADAPRREARSLATRVVRQASTSTQRRRTRGSDATRRRWEAAALRRLPTARKGITRDCGRHRARCRCRRCRPRVVACARLLVSSSHLLIDTHRVPRASFACASACGNAPAAAAASTTATTRSRGASVAACCRRPSFLAAEAAPRRFTHLPRAACVPHAARAAVQCGAKVAAAID